MKLIKRLRCLLLGHRHDMTFPNGMSLEWVFVCERCGHTTSDIDEATP